MIISLALHRSLTQWLRTAGGSQFVHKVAQQRPDRESMAGTVCL